MNGNKHIRLSWLYWLITRLLSRETKRKIVMVSAFIGVEKHRGFNTPRLHKLNRVMKLTSSDVLLEGLSELALPLSEEYCLPEGHCSIAQQCRGLADSIPLRMRYDTDEVIINDIASVVVCNI